MQLACFAGSFVLSHHVSLNTLRPLPEKAKLHMEGPYVGAPVSITRLSVTPAQALDIQVQRAFRKMIPIPGVP